MTISLKYPLAASLGNIDHVVVSVYVSLSQLANLQKAELYSAMSKGIRTVLETSSVIFLWNLSLKAELCVKEISS